MINAYAKDGNYEKAELLLTEMRQQEGEGGVKADLFSYSSVLEAWSRSGSPQAGEKADTYLKILEDYPEHNNKRALRYTLAHICWRNSIQHHPQAEQRLPRKNYE